MAQCPACALADAVLDSQVTRLQPQTQPRGCSKNFEERRWPVLGKAETLSGEVRYQHLAMWLQQRLVLPFTRMIKEISLDLEHSKWNKG